MPVEKANKEPTSDDKKSGLEEANKELASLVLQIKKTEDDKNAS